MKAAHFCWSLLACCVTAGCTGHSEADEGLPSANSDGLAVGGNGGGGPGPCPFFLAGGSPDIPDFDVFASQDTTIAKADPSANLGSDTACVAKGGATERACLLKFDLTSVPTNRVVTKACLRLSIADSSVRSFSPRRLLQPWTEAGATWNDRQAGTAWQVPGAKGSLDRNSSDLASIVGSSSGTITIGFNLAVVQDWIANPGTNHGMTIANSDAYDGISFHSSEGAASSAPRLLFE